MSESNDPRLSHAEQLLQAAHAKLAAEDAKKPRSKKRKAQGRLTGKFALNFSATMLIHVFQCAVALTLVLLALVLTIHMLHIDVTLGKAVGVPTGFLTAAALGYVSACYLGVIESTAAGHTDIELDGDWKEWFWTLPMTLGMLGLSAFIGWLISLALPDVPRSAVIGTFMLLLYPFLQLSALETGSPTMPFSLPIARSIIRHPAAWIILYTSTFALVGVVWAVTAATWLELPYITMLFVGPTATAALFVFAWLLGQLAHLASSDEEN